MTSEWPLFEGDVSGIHVINQIRHLRQHGWKVDVFSFQGRKNPVNYWRAICELRRLNLNQYDVIHAHHGQAGLVAVLQNQCPVVITFHGSDLQGIRNLFGKVTLQGYVLKYASRWVAKCANAVILVSQHLACFLPRKIPYKIIPAGIDLELFRPLPKTEARSSLRLPSNGRLVLFVGSPTRTEKRFWLAQKAVESLPENVDAQLVLANGVPNDQMPLYMNACDVLLVTSSTEGSPNVVKEALACNLPVVSTDVGDVRIRLTSIQGCYISLDDRPETLAQDLRKVLERPNRIKGREHVLDLDEANLVFQVTDVYKKVMSER